VAYSPPISRCRVAATRNKNGREEAGALGKPEMRNTAWSLQGHEMIGYLGLRILGSIPLISTN
jgi:hypothetical protein